VANSSGAQGAQDKVRYFCHSCGGVTIWLTPKEAADQRLEKHDLEAFPLSGDPRDQAFRTIQASRPEVALG